MPRRKQGESGPKRVKESLAHITPLAWNADETAHRLGISVQRLYELRKAHPLYRPNCRCPRPSSYKPQLDATGKPIEKKHFPMWTDELLNFIIAAWEEDETGERTFTDDDAFAIWKQRRSRRREEYLECCT